jgi:hypothetical protein
MLAPEFDLADLHSEPPGLRPYLRGAKRPACETHRRLKLIQSVQYEALWAQCLHGTATFILHIPQAFVKSSRPAGEVPEVACRVQCRLLGLCLHCQ